MIYGGYPDVLNLSIKTEKQEYLETLVNSLLLKDILELERVKSSQVVMNLLRLLAFQIG
jgi:predicted AAA+ superfamily ATPase